MRQNAQRGTDAYVTGHVSMLAVSSRLQVRQAPYSALAKTKSPGIPILKVDLRIVPRHMKPG